MRLANGIIIDKEKTFGVLKFSALRREVHIQNEDGTVSEEIKERTYDLKSRGQGRMIQVSIPASVPLKEFDYKYINETAVADTVKDAGYDPYEHKVLGVTAMTKLLGKTRFEELLSGFIEKPQGKPTLVPMSDKRPAMNTAANDFKEEN